MNDNALSFQVDPYFRDYCGPHPKRDELKELIRRDGMIDTPVIVWDEWNILIDGHTRSEIHAELTAEGVQLPPLPVVRRSFAYRDEAEQYCATRQGTMREMNPNRRAMRYLLNHSDELATLRNLARQNQSAAGGNNTADDGSAVSARAPEAVEVAPEPIDVRARIAQTVNVPIKVAGAAIKLMRYLAQTDNPKIAEYQAVADAFERGEFTANEVKNYFDKVEQDAREDARRDDVIAEPVAEIPPSEDAGTIAPDSLVTDDWVHGLQRIAPGSVAMHFTSPPYPLLGYEYANGRTAYNGDYGEYLEWLKRGFTECFRTSRAGGRMIVQIDSVSAIHEESGLCITLPIYADVMNLMREIGYTFFYEICWYKQTTGGSKGTRWGTYREARAPFVRRTHEYILVFFKGTPVLDGNESGDTILKDEFGYYTLSQWYVPPVVKSRREKWKSETGVTHRCPFPLDLPYRCIQLLTRKGDVICDPFNGSGTTTLAAHCLGRRYIGLDRDKEYTSIAQNRLAEVSALTPADRLKWIRGQLYKSNPGERKDGWGPSTHDGNNFSRRFNRRKPPKD